MATEIYGCPECQANLMWQDATTADPARFECPKCNTTYSDVDEIKARILEMAKEAGKKV